MKKIYYNYVALNTFTYAAIGVLLPLMGQYLIGLGFTGAQIGTITSAGTAMAIFSTTFLGEKYNNMNNKKLMVMCLCFSAAAIGGCLLWTTGYWVFLWGFIILYFFQAPIMGLSDAMTIEADQPFSAVRKWGCIGFALAVFVAGRIADVFGLQIIFTGYAICFVIAGLFILAIVRSESRGRQQQAVWRTETAATDQEQAEAILEELKDHEDKLHRKIRYRDVVKNRKLLGIIAASFFLLGTNVANNTYFSFLYIECGGTIAGIGTAFLLMVGSETIFMALSARISTKFTIEKTLLASMCISALRFAWYSFGPPSYWIIALFFLQGMVNGIILVEFIRYINKTVSRDHLGMSISLYYAASSFSTILCQLAGGIVLDVAGGTGVYLFFAIYNVIGVVLYVIFGLHKGVEGPGEKNI